MDGRERRFVALWIWSLLTVVSAVLCFRVVGGLPFGSGLRLAGGLGGVAGSLFARTPWAAILGVAPILIGIPLLVSMFSLFQFLGGVLLPAFFSEEEAIDRADGPELLRRAFGGILVAVCIWVGLGVVCWVLA